MLSDVIVVENFVDHQCVRHVHVMSNLPLGEYEQRRYAPWGIGQVTVESGVYHFRATYPYHGMLDIACVGNEKRFRRMVAWHLEGCKSVTQALDEARKEYCRLFGGAPEFAFIRKMPRGAENGVKAWGMTFLEAEWMLEKCVAVGGRQL